MNETSGSAHETSRRTRISDDNLHISAFAIVGDGKGSILLVKAGEGHALSFRRGKLLLPATMLQFGEWPYAA
ncbi:MAG: hypothetical protein ABSF83_09075, partial [Nitrososphaerales archaeon]